MPRTCLNQTNDPLSQKPQLSSVKRTKMSQFREACVKICSDMNSLVSCFRNHRRGFKEVNIAGSWKRFQLRSLMKTISRICWTWLTSKMTFGIEFVQAMRKKDHLIWTSIQVVQLIFCCLFPLLFIHCSLVSFCLFKFQWQDLASYLKSS